MNPEVRTALILVAAVGAGIGVLSVAFSVLDAPDAAPAVTGDGAPPVDKSRFKQAPDLVGIAHHLNTTPEELEERIADSVVLYDIWTYSCINCIRTLPYITAWDAKYADDGLLIIGVHSPEFEFEKSRENVEAAVAKHGIGYPVVMDNDMETWKAFENRYWPRKYIADHEGYVRYDHIGEGGYDETERVIQGLIAERAAALGMQAASAEELVDIDEFEHSFINRTPELYFGYNFAFNRNHLGSEEGFRPGSTVMYAEPAQQRQHFFYPVGEWANHPESMELVSGEGRILLDYNAKQVNIVTEGEADLEVLLDGAPVPDRIAGADLGPGGTLRVSEPGLYNLVEGGSAESHSLEIRVDGAGFQIFTFTFG